MVSLRGGGAKTAIPSGFEICDGSSPTTLGALPTVKPDLRGRFPRGAETSRTNVASSPITGGSDVIDSNISGGTAISLAQLPSYTLPNTLVTATDGNHSHTISGARNRSADEDAGDNGPLASGDNNTFKSGTASCICMR